MWMGFAVKHVGKKLIVGGTIVAGAVLSTRSGRKLAKVVAAGVKGAGEGVFKEIKAQHQAEHPDEVK